jgi:hypothetical protein
VFKSGVDRAHRSPVLDLQISIKLSRDRNHEWPYCVDGTPTHDDNDPNTNVYTQGIQDSNAKLKTSRVTRLLTSQNEKAVPATATASAPRISHKKSTAQSAIYTCSVVQRSTSQINPVVSILNRQNTLSQSTIDLRKLRFYVTYVCTSDRKCRLAAKQFSKR